MDPVMVFPLAVFVVAVFLLATVFGYMIGRHIEQHAAILEMRGKRNIMWLFDKETKQGKYVWSDDSEPVHFLKGVGE